MNRPVRLRRPAILIALVLTSSCSKLPQSVASLPNEVNVIKVELTDENAAELNFLAIDRPSHKKFAHQVKVQGQPDGGILRVVCERTFSPSRMCKGVDVVCRNAKNEQSFHLELRQDGLVLVELGPPWESTPDDMVEIHLITLGQPDPNLFLPVPKSFQAQLSEGVVDPQSLVNRADPYRIDSPWFNQLDIAPEGLFVSVHQAHPQYLQVVSTLTIAGKFWLANAPHFADCGFSGPGDTP